MISIKSAISRLRWRCFAGRGRAHGAADARRLAAFGGGFAAALAAVFAPREGHRSRIDIADVGGTAEKLFGLAPLFPRKVQLRHAAVDAAFWRCAPRARVLALVEPRAVANAAALVILAFVLRLGPLPVYRNAFGYSYGALAPAAGLAIAAVVAKVESRLAGRPVALLLAVVVVSAAPLVQAARFHRLNSGDGIATQRSVLKTIHQVFPRPVPYIDRCGMVASFPKVGPFMTTFVMADYRRAGRPICEERLRRQRPAFVLHNTPAFALQVRQRRIPGKSYRLLRRDFKILRSHYVRHWGPLWVAGKRFRALGDQPVAFDLLVAGTYTVESKRVVELDGRAIAARGTVDLAQGRHRIRCVNPGDDGKDTVTLRWGDHLRRPKRKPPARESSTA